jgi:hypothetical protein
VAKKGETQAREFDRMWRVVLDKDDDNLPEINNITNSRRQTKRRNSSAGIPRKSRFFAGKFPQNPRSKVFSITC